MKKTILLLCVLFLALGAQAQSVDNVNSNAAKESVYDQVEVKITKAIIAEDVIADEASPELADIRRKIRSENNRIKDNLQKYVSGAYGKYLQENIKYPSAALAEKAQGKAFVRFVVEKDGSITNTEIIKSTGNIYLDKEALRVASNMPKWKPGMQQGKPVRVFFMLPVSFKL